MKTWKTRATDFWRGYARPFLFVVVILTAFRSSVADWNDVPSGSMKPSILEGDRIFVNKLAYDLKVPFTTWRVAEWSSPARGDIVVFFSPADGTRLVKRVVGLPGDRVEMIDDHLIINGKPLPYAQAGSGVAAEIPPAQRPLYAFAQEGLPGHAHPVMVTPGIAAMRSFGPLTVPAGHYFMMGDNRDNSADSRYFGPVPNKLIVGRASAVIASLNIDDCYIPRWKRFFHSLP